MDTLPMTVVGLVVGFGIMLGAPVLGAGFSTPGAIIGGVVVGGTILSAIKSGTKRGK